MSKEWDLTQAVTMPTIALRGLTVVPSVLIHFEVARDASIKALEAAMKAGSPVFLVGQKDMSVENASAELRRVMKGGDGHEKMMADYAELAAVVGGAGASERFACRMVELLKSER